jgi:hypothetical protein
MGGGSKQINPKFLTPPDIGSLRPDFARALAGLLSGGPFGNLNPLQSAAMQQYQGLLTGTGPESPGTSAYKTLLEATQTGLPANTGPIADQAFRNFSQYTAPAIKESLGAQYGVRFGTPVAESLSRAGADVTSNLNAEFARLSNDAQNRRLGASAQVGGIAQGGYSLGAQPMNDWFSMLNSGVGTLSGGQGFANPQFAPSSGQQNLQSAAQLAAAIAAIYASSGCWIAEAIWGKWATETWKVRFWLHDTFQYRWYGRPLVALYRRYGRRLATKRWVVRICTPFFERALLSASNPAPAV